MDCVSKACFALEALLKIISAGFLFNGKDSYLRVGWNQLDFTILIFSILALTPLPNSLKLFKIFQVIRILKLIGQNQSLRIGMHALLLALPNMLNATIIMLFFFLKFGMLLVSYFKGKMLDCNLD